MNIEGLNQPVAGKQFDFRVTGGTRPTHIEVYIDGAQVMDTDCADPPCHEMIFIPRGARNAEIWVIARDIFGKEEHRKFVVRDSDASSSNAMAAGG